MSASDSPLTAPDASPAFDGPRGAIIQVAYTTADIARAMQAYGEALRLAPWFVRGPFQPAKALYRGRPTPLSVTLAIAFSGSLWVELIEQHDDGPSVFRDIADRRGHGFHHWGVATDRFEAEAARYAQRGYELAFYDVLPVGSRIAYFDTTRDLPGMVELIEMNEAQERRYARLRAEALAWEGGDPVRRMP